MRDPQHHSKRLRQLSEAAFEIIADDPTCSPRDLKEKLTQWPSESDIVAASNLYPECVAIVAGIMVDRIFADSISALADAATEFLAAEPDCNLGGLAEKLFRWADARNVEFLHVPLGVDLLDEAITIATGKRETA